MEKNKSTLSLSDYDNYNKQFQLMKDVCLEYEKESETDSEETKNGRFIRILGLMEQVCIIFNLCYLFITIDFNHSDYSFFYIITI